MAAAEARTAWQRVANRCFVQEDAKRAPKLACCPSSSSKLESDYSNTEGAYWAENPVANLMPLNWNHASPNLPPDTKWWLQMQPNFGHQKDIIYDPLNAPDTDLEDKPREISTPSSKLNVDPNVNKDDDSFPEPPRIVSTAFMKNDTESKVEEMKAVNKKTQSPLKHKEDLGGHWYEGDELIDWKSLDLLISKKPDKACFNMDSNWMCQKTEPWWRIADKDELELLVAQKSLDKIENCDLPPPQKVHVSNNSFSCMGSFEEDDIFSSFEKNVGSEDYAQHSSASGSVNRKQLLAEEIRSSLYGSEKLYSTRSYDSPTKDSQEKTHAPDDDPMKAQLLEALCHSQTRAREAEIAAQKAYDEKEHILKLFFKQASHLFAYKQWLNLLQLESLCLQLKIKEQQLSTLFPPMPWIPSPDNDKGAKKKGKKRKTCGFCRYIFSFAFGVGMASAGLLLGWTLGWLLPTM